MDRRAFLTFGLLIFAGCAQRADWIGGTLVTVDVTGRWTGNYSRSPGGNSGSFDMTLRQTSPKVTGDLGLGGPNVQLWAGRIEGTVSGDVLRFSRPDGQLRGEVTVADDVMTGTATFGTGYDQPGQPVA